VRQNKRLAKKRASNFVQVPDVDERDVAIKAERSQDRRLWILGIEPIDLMRLVDVRSGICGCMRALGSTRMTAASIPVLIAVLIIGFAVFAVARGIKH
jgi:hypothetical protein